MSQIAELFEKISHPTRLKILNLLLHNPMNFSQLKNALNIESNGNLDHHLKKLDTLIYLDSGGLYKLSDDGKEAIRAIQVMESSITPKKRDSGFITGQESVLCFPGNHLCFSSPHCSCPFSNSANWNFNGGIYRHCNRVNRRVHWALSWRRRV